MTLGRAVLVFVGCAVLVSDAFYLNAGGNSVLGVVCATLGALLMLQGVQR